LRFLKKEIFCKDHKIKLYSVKNNNLKKLLLISGDYGTYNPFNIIADRLEKYGIQTTHLNNKINKNIKYDDFIELVALIGTSTDSWFEELWIEKLIENKVDINIFIDEVYNLEKRLSFLKKYKGNIKNIYYSGMLDLDSYIPNANNIICINPSFNKEYLIQRFNYKYNPSGPLVIIDEFKDEFKINKIFSKKEYKKMHVSDLLKKEFSIVDEKIIKIRSHPNLNSKDNYLSGEASGFIGYSSMALAELSFLGFKAMSIASDEVESIATSIFKLNAINENMKEDQLDLKTIFNNFQRPNDKLSYFDNDDIIPQILNLL
tara:strand:- start:1993 stop:2943 length:951 start_codon:yes stop_codon:yes gene_type:complete